MTVRHRGRHVFDSIAAKHFEGLPQYILGTEFFVSKNDGGSTNSGTSPNAPVDTVQAAIDKANALVDWSKTPMKRQVIWVEPGVYPENLTPAYYADIVGLGIRGTDQMAEVHPTTGSVMTGTLLGAAFRNMWFEVDEQDAEIFDIGICNNSEFSGCTFALGANVTGVVAIDTENCTHLVIDDCDFESGQLQDMAYAIYHRGGADKFAHNCRYRRNRIFAKTMGIYIDQLCTASKTIIGGPGEDGNIIHVAGTGTGIDGYGGGADSGGQAIAVNNHIIIVGAGDAIHGLAAGKKLMNRTLVNGAYALETA